MNPRYCVQCQSNGRQTVLQKIFAISEDDLKSLDPTFIQLSQLISMLNSCVIVDRGYCEKGHGLVQTTEEPIKLN